MFEQKFDTHKVSLHLVVHEHFPLISWLNYSFCICHTMLKLNWSNSITTKWKCFSPPSSKQIFSDGDEIKRRHRVTHFAYWMAQKHQNLQSVRNYAVNIDNVPSHSPRKFASNFHYLCRQFHNSSSDMLAQACFICHKMMFSSVCVFPSHPQFMSQFVMLYESSNLVSFVRVGEEKFAILATFPGSAYFSISFLSSSPTLRFRSSQGRVSIK